MKSCTATMNTPMGKLMITESNGFITKCCFTRSTLQVKPASAVLRLALSQLKEYFNAQRVEFELPLAPGGTSFQRKVWAALQTIPHGERWSYQQLAGEVGNPKAYRAVGSANAKNPIGIIIPCHRVIRASGEAGGYAGGEEVKVRLLEFENNRYKLQDARYK